MRRFGSAWEKRAGGSAASVLRGLRWPLKSCKSMGKSAAIAIGSNRGDSPAGWPNDKLRLAGAAQHPALRRRCYLVSQSSSETLEPAHLGSDQHRAVPRWRQVAAVVLLLLGLAIYLNETYQAGAAKT